MGKLIRLELFSKSSFHTRESISSIRIPYSISGQGTDMIADFKSYKGHHVMLFGDSYFTSIIGPNGSGKSNS